MTNATDTGDPSPGAAPHDGIFRSLVGQDGAKLILRRALRRGDVHVLMDGPPASGKSVALLGIEGHVDGAVYRDSKGLSERKLRDLLADNPPVLLLDEFDHLDADAYKALNTALEQGRVTKDVYGDSYDVEIDTQVLTAINHRSRVPDDVADRFVPVEFEPYSRDEFIEVCRRLLPEQVDWIAQHDEPVGQAEDIAAIVWDRTDTNSPRLARDAARLAGRTGNVEPVVRAMNNPAADVDSEPLTADELPHDTGDNDDGAEQSPKPKSLDDVRERMADPDEIESKDVSEIQAMFSDADGDDDADEPADTDTEADDATDETPADDGDAGGGLDAAVGFDSGRDYITQMMQSGNRVLPNNFAQPGVGLIFPEGLTDEMMTLVDQWDINPAGPDVLAQPPGILKDELSDDVVDGLREIQFVADDPNNVDTTGYDLNQIVQAVEDEPVLVSISPAIQWQPPWD